MEKKCYSNNRRSIIAASEVIEHIFLLLIAVCSCTVIYYNVLSVDFSEKETNALLTGSVDNTDLIIEHSGGVPIDLESRLLITLAGNKINEPVGNRVQDDNQDGYWNIGEKMSFPIGYNLINLWKYKQVSMAVVDHETNSMIFMGGDIGLVPKSDAEVTISVNDLSPKIGDVIIITINVTSYGGDVNGSGNVTVHCSLPEELGYIESNSPSGHGLYNNETGLWNVGNVFVGSPATLKIYAIVLRIGTGTDTQFVLINDVSKWMYDRPNKWNEILQGVNIAMTDDTSFPHYGHIEFSFLKYGYQDIPRATAELKPTIITEENYQTVAGNLRNPTKNFVFGGRLPMCCGFRLATDLLYKSQNFDPKIRQVILLFTTRDGNPDCIWIPGSYNASPTNPVNYTAGRSSAEDAIEYLKSKLNLTETKDQIDVLVLSDTKKEKIDDVQIIPWFNNSIVWPTPNIWDYSKNSTPSHPGWVTYINVQSPQELSSRVRLIFRLLLGLTEVDVEIVRFNNVRSTARERLWCNNFQPRNTLVI